MLFRDPNLCRWYQIIPFSVHSWCITISTGFFAPATEKHEQILTAAEWKNHKIVKDIARIKAAHGSYDNDIMVVDQTIARIIGKPLPHSVENHRY